MLLTIAFQNYLQSLKKYRIYFMAVPIAIAFFYAINTIGLQGEMLGMNESWSMILLTINSNLANIMNLPMILPLIALTYIASRFIISRRAGELAICMSLGMRRLEVLLILHIEIAIKMVVSLVLGILSGMALSVLFSAFIAVMAGIDMSAYHFMISGSSILLTVILFAGSHLIAFLFSLFFVLRMKTIDLLRPAFFMESDVPRHPFISFIKLLLSAAVLAGTFPLSNYLIRLYFSSISYDGSFYYSSYEALLAFGDALCAYLRWLCAGLILYYLDQIIRYYYPDGILRRTGLKSFNAADMTVRFRRQWLPIIAGITFFFSAATDTANSTLSREFFKQIFDYYCPADMMAVSIMDPRSSDDSSLDILSRLRKNGLDPAPCLSESVSLLQYGDPSLSYRELVNDDPAYYEDAINETVPVFKCTDYNRVARLYGLEEITLAEGEYALVCNEAPTADEFYLQKTGLLNAEDITIFGHSLHSFRDTVAIGFMEIGMQPLNHGFYVVRDDVPDESFANRSWLIGNFAGKDQNEKTENEGAFRRMISQLSQKDQEGFLIRLRSDILIERKQFNLLALLQYEFSTIVTFVICGTIFTLILIFDTIDNSRSYSILEIMGDDLSEIDRKLQRRSLLLFCLPLPTFLFAMVSPYRSFAAADPVFHLSLWSFLLVTLRTLLSILLPYGSCYLFALAACREILRSDRKNGIREAVI